MNIRKEHIIIALVPFFLILLFSFGSAKSSLPPIDIRGHTETYPPSRVSDTPLDISTHKHILEHTPAGRGGIVINYNCEDFECSPSLMDKLSSLAYKYKYVYIAPYPGMKAKLVLSKYGKRLVLEDYDESKIISFIEE